jgi:hypothetical protein
MNLNTEPMIASATVKYKTRQMFIMSDYRLVAVDFVPTPAQVLKHAPQQ